MAMRVVPIMQLFLGGLCIWQECITHAIILAHVVTLGNRCGLYLKGSNA